VEIGPQVPRDRLSGILLLLILEEKTL